MLSLIFATAAHATLNSRLDGAAAYDDVLDITWLTDASLSGSSSWEGQLAWVESLNSSNYLGFNDWRLASMSIGAGLPTGATTSVLDCATVWEPLCRDNELSYMFYHNLGGGSGSDLTGNQTVGDVTLTNVQPVYWSGTEYAQGSAWIIHFTSGFGVWSFKSGNRYAWAVRSGDVLAPDTDGDGHVDSVDNCPTVANDQTDSDGDTIGDSCDNCINAENVGQLDTDGDFFGNRCDADLDNMGFVNFGDLALFKHAFGTPNPHADLDGSGFVNFADLAIFKQLFGYPPGPSGTAP